MADRQFRFRLPWLSSSAATRPTAEPQPSRPAPEIQAPARPTTTVVPIQRPPVRAAGIVPPQPPPIQAQSQRTEPLPPQPIPQTVSQPVSPTRAITQERGSSVPPSPRREISESRLTSRPTSPTRETSQTRSPSRVTAPSRPSSVPPSPTRRTFQQPQSQLADQRSPKTSPSRIPTQEPKTETTETIKKITETDEPKKAEELKTDESKVITAESSLGPQSKGLEDATVRGERRRKGEHTKTVNSTHARAKHSIIDSHDKTFTSYVQQVPLHKEIREDISKLIHKVGTIQSNQPMDEKQVSVITLAGENKGATMQVGSESAKKEESVHIHRGYKTNPDESTEGTTTDGEASSRGRGSKKAMKEEPATKAYINSNIQSVNNSILFESKVSENDPGVHLDLSHNQPEPATPKLEPVARKAEFNITPAQKLTYEPTVRRRCLRGLFLEPSDDELDNPDKPRRHGCRFTCGENSKDIGIF